MQECLLQKSAAVADWPMLFQDCIKQCTTCECNKSVLASNARSARY
jgi:hypothetical protein